MISSIRILSFFILIVASAAYAVPVDHVIIVSIDGGKPSVMIESEMPNIEMIVKYGSSSLSAQTVNPSVTLPAHTSMLTGVLPSVHKVDWNFWNPFKGTVKTPTIFSIAKSKGFSTALFAGKTKFKHLKVKGSLDKFKSNSGNSIKVAQAASEYLAAKKPNILFVHMPDPDSVGHSSGWGSADQKKAFERVDQAIGILTESITETLAGKRYAMIITADHGGTGKSHGSSSASDKTIPWIIWGTGIKKNQIITRDVSVTDTAATALYLLGIQPPASWHGKPVTEALQD